MNLDFFKFCHHYTNSKLSNVGEFPCSWSLGNAYKLRKERKLCCRVFTSATKHLLTKSNKSDCKYAMMAKNFNKNLKRANWFLGTFIDEVQFWYICYFGFTVQVCNDEWSAWCVACVTDVIQPWLVTAAKQRNTLVLGAKRTQRITRNAFRISVQPDWPIRPIYSYGWKQGWRWPCSDTNLRALLCKSSYSYAN